MHNNRGRIQMIRIIPCNFLCPPSAFAELKSMKLFWKILTSSPTSPPPFGSCPMFQRAISWNFIRVFLLVSLLLCFLICDLVISKRRWKSWNQYSSNFINEIYFFALLLSTLLCWYRMPFICQLLGSRVQVYVHNNPFIPT